MPISTSEYSTSSLTQHDQNILKYVHFKFPRMKAAKPEEGGDEEVPPDNNNKPDAKLFSVAFQFPPYITSDTRSAEWIEELMPGSEDIAVLISKSGSRKLSMEWEYIVGARGGKNNSVYTPKIVANQLHNLRSYFVSSYQFSNPTHKRYIAYLKAWLFGGRREITVRMTSLNITHGNNMVTDKSGDYFKTFPLYTKVACELKIWSQRELSSATEENGQDSKAPSRYNVDGLIKTVSFNWQ